MDSPLALAQDITSRPTNDLRRRTYHLWLENGRELKGRYYVTKRFGQVAQRIRDIARLDFLPTVAACKEDAILEEWIDGHALSDGAVDEAAIAECGRMLGRIHHSIPPLVDDLGFKTLSIQDWFQMMCRSLAELVRANVLSAAHAQQLETMAHSHLPMDQRIGIVHRDLCAENVVKDPHGRYVLVDNALLTLGLIEEDLCRTWYLWPMTVAERKAFASGYKQFGDASALENPPVFWRIVVVANSARFRLAVSPAASTTALERLSDLLQPSDKGSCGE